MTTPTIGRPAGGGLVPVGYQFPLARPIFDLPSADDLADSAPAPYGIRFFRPAGDVQDMVPIPYRYNAELQVAVTDDGTDTPLIDLAERLEPTTTGTSDGRHPRGEDFRTDPVPDM